MLQSGMNRGFQGLVFLLYRPCGGVFLPCLQCGKDLPERTKQHFLPNKSEHKELPGQQAWGFPTDQQKRLVRGRGALVGFLFSYCSI
jgi:hypothetical protein